MGMGYLPSVFRLSHDKLFGGGEGELQHMWGGVSP